MKKNALRVAIAVAVLLVAAYLAADFLLGSIVKAGVNRFAPRLTRTEVTLAGARLSPLTGSGTLTGLYIGNPSGWGSGPAVYFGRIHMKLAPGSIFRDHVVIDDLEIDKPEFTYETKILSSNIGELLKNIEGSGGSGGPPPAKNGKPLKFEVKHFEASGGLVRLGVGSAALPIPMPPVALDDIGTSEGGVTADQLAAALMRSMASGVVSATTHAAAKVGSTLGAAAGAGLHSIFGGHSSH